MDSDSTLFERVELSNSVIYSDDDEGTREYQIKFENQSDYRVVPSQDVTDQEEDNRNNTASSSTLLLNDSPAPMKAVKYSDEHLELKCRWISCNYQTTILSHFLCHIQTHASSPTMEIIKQSPSLDEAGAVKVYLVCKWGFCDHREMQSHDFLRHLYLHAYHSKLKSLGENTTKRSCQTHQHCLGDEKAVDIVPTNIPDFQCVWDNCIKSFVNIQEYFDHVRYHCIENEKGKCVPGGIQCLWKACRSSFPNITKLRDHVKSHTREKLNACPKCGSLFTSRTRLIDHYYRQGPVDDNFKCDLCLRKFGSDRLLRDHLRSHVNSYRCSECDMSCVTPSALASHMNYRHTTVGTYACPHCPYRAKTNSDLLRHDRIHSLNFLQCNVGDCSFKARTERTLRMHQLRKHSELDSTARYLCHLCKCRYSRGYSLTKHLIKVHDLQWPSGHIRFRYKMQPDGFFQLLTIRYESEHVECAARVSDI